MDGDNSKLIGFRWARLFARQPWWSRKPQRLAALIFSATEWKGTGGGPVTVVVEHYDNGLRIRLGSYGEFSDSKKWEIRDQGGNLPELQDTFLRLYSAALANAKDQQWIAKKFPEIAY